MDQSESTIKPVEDATSDETLADIEESEKVGDSGSDDDIASPDGALDEADELKDAEP
jgi:hypothetical protein